VGPVGEKKRVAGVVDRIEGDIVVVVIRDPDDPEGTREVYVPRSKIKKVELQEGDRVTVIIG
jgi:transcription termination factor Rho